MSDSIQIRVRGGYIIASISPDVNYPGIDVEFVSDTDSGENASRPRVLLECPRESGELRALVWANKNDEDYTHEISFGSVKSFDVSICADCQYIGDKYSFPMPNDMRDVDPQNPLQKRYYCCCGDSDHYEKDITGLGISVCECFEEL